MDPQMPVLVSLHDHTTGKDFLEEWAPERATKAFAEKLHREEHQLPSWREDPTYDLKRKPHRHGR